MKYVFTKQEEPGGPIKLIMESEDAEGKRTRLCARGIPPALANDAAYLESLKIVALKEHLAASPAPEAPPPDTDLGVIEI